MLEQGGYATNLDAAREIISRHQRFIVLEHEKPDGDCVGSGLALVLALHRLDKQAILVSHDPHPAVYDFLPGRPFHTRAAYLSPEDVNPEVAIFVDCTDPERAGSALELARGAVWLNVDHHVSNSMFGAINLVDPQASATGEIVCDLIESLGIPLSVDIGTCIYVAIMTDTGGFRYQNTTPKAFRLAAKLLEQGVRTWEVSDQVFESRTLSSLLLLGKALSTLKVSHGGRVAMITVTRDMMKATGSTPEETEGIINYARSVAGVEVALLFRESEDGKGVHVSFRSRSKVDVAAIAVSLGGGGHARAAGVMLPGTIEEATRKVLDVLGGLGIWTDS